MQLWADEQGNARRILDTAFVWANGLLPHAKLRLSLHFRLVANGQPLQRVNALMKHHRFNRVGGILGKKGFFVEASPRGRDWAVESPLLERFLEFERALWEIEQQSPTLYLFSFPFLVRTGY